MTIKQWPISKAYYLWSTVLCWQLSRANRLCRGTSEIITEQMCHSRLILDFEFYAKAWVKDSCSTTSRIQKQPWGLSRAQPKVWKSF